MARSSNLRKGRSDSAAQLPNRAKRIRKPSARAAPSPPPSRPPKRARKKAAAAPQPNTPSPAATESVIALIESDGGVEVEPSSEPFPEC